MGKDELIEISELFYSIQGESSYAGYPCFFIRFADCNLRCTYCDTRYAYDGEHSPYSIGQILAEAEKYPGALVEITGGEPLLQKNIYPLLQKLISAGRKVLLETNGSLSLEKIPREVIKIVDMKCPGSSMHEHMDFDNFAFLNQTDEVKFVIGSRDDYSWAVKLVEENDLANRSTVTFSPVNSKLIPAQLAEWVLADQLPVRLRLQLHTILWPEKTRGY